MRRADRAGQGCPRPARPAADGGFAVIRLTLIAVMVLQVSIFDAITVQSLLRQQPWGADFLPMWTAAKAAWRGHARLYDFTAMSQAQDWLLGPVHKPRPFAYPPSALILLAPFALVGFWAGLALWCAATFAANAWASFKAMGRVSTLALCLVFPGSIVVLICGQVTLLVAALSLLGLVWLERRPSLAGVMFALAISLKPSNLVLLPVALVAARAWRALVIAALTASALAAASALLFGLGAWTGWLAALPQFQAVVMADPSLVKRMVAPMALARWAGASGPVLAALQVVLALVAVAYAWTTFRAGGARATTNWAERMTALLGGGLIAAPYAMQYETALLAAPAAMLVARAATGRALAVAAFAYLLLALATLPPFGAMATAAFIAIAAMTLRAPRRADPIATGSRPSR